VLEVGCGTGHWLGVLHECGAQVTGLDASAQMLARAQVIVPGVQLVHGQAERLPWPAESFDRVFCINAFHHFTDKTTFLAEARRVLRPDGILMIVGLDPHSGVDQWCVYDYFEGTVEIDKQRYPSSSSIREWMRIAGFEDCVTREVQHLCAQLPAREALEHGQLHKAVTSQLSVLTDEEYQRGIERIKTEIKRTESRGQTLLLTVDLRLYGTSGSVRSTSR
jgi:SAM-dependent methyltransferase